MKIDLVAIPSAKPIRRSNLRRNVIIGTSFSAIALLLILLFILFAAHRRWRPRSQVEQNTTKQKKPPLRRKAFVISPTPREIDQNSIVGPVRELPNSEHSKHELFDKSSPSGSGLGVSEMVDPRAPIAHELRTHRSSRVMIETRRANISKIFMSTNISRKSWISVASSESTRQVETVISALARRKDSSAGTASLVASNSEQMLYSSYAQKSPDLNRPLPPTPISESLQTSPVVVEFEEACYAARKPQIVQLPARGSMSAFVSPDIPVSRYTVALGNCKNLPLSVTLAVLETKATRQHTAHTVARGPSEASEW